MKHLRIFPILLLACFAIGCGTSSSYKYGVENAYPYLADKLDDYAGNESLAEELRASATKPITYERASDAWLAASSPFRTSIMGDTNMPEFTRGKWLYDADKADTLNMEEANRRSFFFLPP